MIHSSMVKQFSIVIFFSLLGVTVFGQSEGSDSLILGTKSIQIIKDNRIDKLDKEYVSTYKLKGYRVQIYSGNKKQPARQARLTFTKLYRKTKAYERYEQPNFKVRVGDFKTKIEALKFKKDLMDHFPNAFIVEDDIEFKN